MSASIVCKIDIWLQGPYISLVAVNSKTIVEDSGRQLVVGAVEQRQRTGGTTYVSGSAHLPYQPTYHSSIRVEDQTLEIDSHGQKRLTLDLANP